MGFILKPSDRKYKDTNPEELDFSIPKKEEVIQEIKDFDPWDYIRVVNVRGEPEYQANDDEKVIVAHRGNPIFGNKHPMKIQTMKEIAKDIVDNKQKIALSCYCSPLLSSDMF